MQQSLLVNSLVKLERLANKLPHPVLLFIYLILVVLVFSALGSYLNWQALHPITKQPLVVTNLLSVEGLNLFWSKMVTNFTGFAPVGSVMIALLGLGIAEKSGLIDAVLSRMVLKAKNNALTLMVVLAGILSNVAVDSGYVILIPLAGVLFHTAGRHPVIGIVACFAGVSAGFSANFLIGPFDAIMAGITQNAAQLINPQIEINAGANYWFMAASTLIIAQVITFIVNRLIEPVITQHSYQVPSENINTVSSTQVKSNASLYTLATLALIVSLTLIGLLPENGVLRNPETQGILDSVFMKGIVVYIALVSACLGCVYGYKKGRFNSFSDVVRAMEESFASLSGYLVLMFFAAQFVALFSWSGIGQVLAIQGAELLHALDINRLALLIGFMIMVMLLNLFIGSASAKWALIAPTFVPMFMLLDIDPAKTQAAYRIADSSTNVITPLMPYLAVVLAFVQRYIPNAGLGTLIAWMFPISISIAFIWTILFAVWWLTDLPFGF
ncbi:aminobenzoyl-glutamate transporter [Saccharobesus litoralis]|uniref:Aminobenzoyl-glutamate transporter n=1 Tax=Saccharobesus litoralis TaxID=2172099 RepID=A0A2S0VPX3_9ALTE|nr:AbgT family transporter [Saccharobesus litoralis]AWB66249.1 aminobenzoyl-glutamate transporter [Saccharobesus litoralis]